MALRGKQTRFLAIMFLMLTTGACEEPSLTATVDPFLIINGYLADLPIGEDNSGDLTEPKRGSVWACEFTSGHGAEAYGDWIKADGTYDYDAKAKVDGSETWGAVFGILTAALPTGEISGPYRYVLTNGVPDHPTGVYPTATDDDAYDFDKNPWHIQYHEDPPLVFVLPRIPDLLDLADATCLPTGPVGIFLTGSVFFNALDAEGRDGVAYEIQDLCQGHPESSGLYHYHSLTECLEERRQDFPPPLLQTHSDLVGYVFDGFGIYGRYGEDGEMLTNDDLDECHGHEHVIEWDGEEVEMYHYHATWEYPYTVGCYRGEPAYP